MGEYMYTPMYTGCLSVKPMGKTDQLKKKTEVSIVWQQIEFYG